MKPLLRLLTILLLFSGSARAQTPTGVTLVNNSTTVVLSNGIVSVTIVKSSGQINNFLYNGTNILAGGYQGGSFYWSWNMPNYQNPSGCTYTLLTDPATNGGTLAEVKLHMTWSGTAATAAMDVDVYYALRPGTSGVYAAAKLSHPASYPLNPGGEWRMAAYPGSTYDWMTVDAARNQIIPNGAATTAAVPGAPAEVLRITSGPLTNHYECKYDYSADFGDIDTWGWSSTTAKIGVWMTTPSKEYYPGGPKKRELMCHMSPVLLNMLGGTHYGMGADGAVAAGETWEKLYGPFLIYCNKVPAATANASQVLWQDAKAQALTEQSQWPYAWFSEPSYAKAAGRGTVNGRLVIQDATVPNASAANMWVGVAVPQVNTTDVTNFQVWSKNYQFWVKTDAAGNFSIPNVLPGTYTLYAFGPGTAGQLTVSAAATVTAGATVSLGNVVWTPTRVAPTIWEIGVPDRSSAEFKHGDDYWVGGTYPSPNWAKFMDYVNEFPQGVTYTVGQSNWATDWDYVQNYNTVATNVPAQTAAPEWKVRFNLSQAPTAGSTSSVYVAVASAFAAALFVKVNGTNITTPTTGVFPANPSDATIRKGNHGAFADLRFSFPSSLLTAGNNEITFTERRAGGDIQYDYLRLEAPGTNLADLVVGTGTTASPTPVLPGTYNSITVTGSGVAQLQGAVSVGTSVTVQSGGTLLTNCQPISGLASFTLAAGATLGICDPAGLSAGGATGAVQTTGPRSLSADASYLYNGTAAQVTGSGLPAQVRNLSTVNPADVTLTAPVAVAQVLTVGGAGNLVLNGQALTLLSTSAGTALAVNSGTGVVQGGTATVQRYLDPSLNAGLGYRHYSAPVSGSTVGDLATAGFAPEVSQGNVYNSSPTPGTTVPFPTVYGYDQSRVATAVNNYGPFDKGFVAPTALTTPLAVGRGYVVNLDAAQLVDFVGTLTSGDVALTLPRNAAATPNAADAGWHLVGNPYPAPLDFSRIAPADRTNLDAAMYVFESTGPYAGAYRTYVNGVGVSPLLGSSQGFFVRVSSGQTSGGLTFRNAQRLTDYASQVPVRRGLTDPRPLVQLDLHGSTGPTDSFYAYAEQGATTGFDASFDAVKRPNTHGLNLTSSAATGEALAIDGRPAFTAATTLPLTVAVPAAGTYAITASLSQLPAGLEAFLVDAQLGQVVNVRQQPSYSFSVTAAQAGNLAGRFSLRFGAQGPLATATALTAAQVSVYPNPAHEGFTVLVPAVAGASQVQAELLNSLGQVVHRQSASLPVAGTQLSMATSGLAAGVYTLCLRAGSSTIIKRVLLY